MKKLLPLITPGEILLEEFMKPLGISQNKLARDIDVPPGRINQIIKGKRIITADKALRLGRYFNMTPQAWINLQTNYDMRVAKRAGEKKINATVRPYASENHAHV